MQVFIPLSPKHGIQHPYSPPHTSQIVGIAERQHRHNLEMTLTLLHQASIRLQFWPVACQTIIYLINQMPIPLLDNKSPFETLFHPSPYYLELKIFGCLCYPQRKPTNAINWIPSLDPVFSLAILSHIIPIDVMTHPPQKCSFLGMWSLWKIVDQLIL